MFITDNFLLFAVLILLISSISSMLITPFVASFAEKFNIIDKPNARKVHKANTPRLGGLSIFISFLIGLAFINEFTGFTFWYVAANLIIVIAGAVDDSQNLSPKVKLLAQIAAAMVVIFMCGVTYPFHSGTPGIVAYLLTFLWIIGVTNAVNLSDGMDGLASTISLVSMIAVFFIALFNDKLYICLLALSFAGGILGFMRYNLPNARIFMGDIGSLFLGFNASVLILMCLKPGGSISNFLYPGLLLPIPIIDTTLAVIRRTRRGQNPLHPDKEHIHHLLLGMRFLKNQVLITYAGYSGIISLLIYLAITKGERIYTLASIIVTLASIIVLYRLSSGNIRNRIRRHNAYIRALCIHIKSLKGIKADKQINTLIVAVTFIYVLMFFYVTFPINNTPVMYIIFLFAALFTISLHFRSVFKIKNHFTTFLSFWMFLAVSYTLLHSELKIYFMALAVVSLILTIVKVYIRKDTSVLVLTPMETIFIFVAALAVYTFKDSIEAGFASFLFALFLYYSNKFFFISGSTKYKKYVFVTSAMFIALAAFSYIYVSNIATADNRFSAHSFNMKMAHIDEHIMEYEFSDAADLIEETYHLRPMGYSYNRLKTIAVRTYPYLFLENIMVKSDKELAVNSLVRFLDMFPNNAEEFFIIVEPVVRYITRDRSSSIDNTRNDTSIQILNEVRPVLKKYKAEFESEMFYKKSENMVLALKLFNKLNYTPEPAQ